MTVSDDGGSPERVPSGQARSRRYVFRDLSGGSAADLPAWLQMHDPIASYVALTSLGKELNPQPYAVVYFVTNDRDQIEVLLKELQGLTITRSSIRLAVITNIVDYEILRDLYHRGVRQVLTTSLAVSTAAKILSFIDDGATFVPFNMLIGDQS